MERKRTLNYSTQRGKAIRAGLEERLKEVSQALDLINVEISSLSERRKLLPIVLDVARGMHLEQDKLCKKGPTEPITSLALSTVNDIINDAKKSAKSDPYIKKIHPFVAAGDNPETRDVVMIMTQVIGGLERAANGAKEELEDVRNRSQEPKLLLTILQSLLEEDTELGMDSVPNGSEYPSWFQDEIEEGEDEDGDFDEDYFPDYERLSSTNLLEYFKNDD